MPIRFGALTRNGFPAGVRPAAEILSFASPKESIQRKGDPKVASSAALRIPCASRLKRRLRNSHQPFGLLLKQSSPTTPFQPAMLGATYGSLSVVTQTVVDYDSLFFVGLQAALVLACRRGCKAIPEWPAGQVVLVARLARSRIRGWP